MTTGDHPFTYYNTEANGYNWDIFHLKSKPEYWEQSDNGGFALNGSFSTSEMNHLSHKHWWYNICYDLKYYKNNVKSHSEAATLILLFLQLKVP